MYIGRVGVNNVLKGIIMVIMNKRVCRMKSK